MSDDEADTRARAEEALRLAIIEHARAVGWLDDGELLSDFVVVSVWVPAEGGDPGQTTSMLHTSTAETPDYVALGLLHVGIGHAVDVVEKDRPSDP